MRLVKGAVPRYADADAAGSARGRLGTLGAGLFYWAPDWIPGVPWEPGTGIGSPNVNLTLFNFEAT